METWEGQTNQPDDLPSAYPEFSDVHAFLQRFRSQLALPEVTLDALEGYFMRGDCENENNVLVAVHSKLLNLVIRRYVDKSNWTVFAGKFAYANSIAGTRDYDELTAYERLKLLKCLCEAQFDRNTDFKACLAKIPETELRDGPIGMDSEGQRYWLLQDSNFDIRLYAEFKYMEYPFDLPRWKLVSRNLEQFEAFIESLRNKQGSGDGQDVDEVANGQDGERDGEENTSRKRSRRSSKGRAGKSSKPKFKGGCLSCHKDNDYGRMLLCDSCDLECHAYCQYPILWDVPEGEWFCPKCRQEQLISSLRSQCDGLQHAKLKQQQALEEHQRKMLRLARGGLSLQNIIEEKMDAEDAGSARRSSRARKEVNYAELNEIHLPHWNRRELFYIPGENASLRRTRNAAPPQSSRRGREEVLSSTVGTTDSCTVTVRSEPLDSAAPTTRDDLFEGLGQESGGSSSEEGFEELRCSVSLDVISQAKLSQQETPAALPDFASEKKGNGTTRVQHANLLEQKPVSAAEDLSMAPSFPLSQTRMSATMPVITAGVPASKSSNSTLLEQVPHNTTCPESCTIDLILDSPSQRPTSPPREQGNDVVKDSADTPHHISEPPCTEPCRKATKEPEEEEETELSKSSLMGPSHLSPSNFVQTYGLSQLPLSVDEV